MFLYYKWFLTLHCTAVARTSKAEWICFRWQFLALFPAGWPGRDEAVSTGSRISSNLPGRLRRPPPPPPAPPPPPPVGPEMSVGRAPPQRHSERPDGTSDVTDPRAAESAARDGSDGLARIAALNTFARRFPCTTASIPGSLAVVCRLSASISGALTTVAAVERRGTGMSRGNSLRCVAAGCARVSLLVSRYGLLGTAGSGGARKCKG